MRELLVEERTCGDGTGRNLRCRYSVLVDEMEVREGFFCESYGVKVTDPISGESASVPNITISVSRIDGLIELLIQNSVTPVTLRDVVDDWI